MQKRPQWPEETRQNPLGAPRYLLEVADGPWRDDLAGVLRRIEALPVEVTNKLEQYFDPTLIDDLRYLVRAMQKLHQDTLPYREELLVLAGPEFTLEPLGRKFGRVAACEPIPRDVAASVESDISKPLLAASEILRWSRGHGAIADWATESSDLAKPEPQ